MYKAYLDYAAGAPIDQHIISDLPHIASMFANPSSLHSAGREAQKWLQNSRSRIADCIGADTGEIFFCSSATHAANIVLRGIDENNLKRDIFYSATEHDCIIETAEDLYKKFVDNRMLGIIPVDSNGFITPDAFAAYLDDVYAYDATIAIQLVNNETGVIQPIKELADIAHHYNSLFVCDISQAAGHIPVNLHNLGVDIAFGSAYKFGGLRGCGILYIKRGVKLPSVMTGGGQEGGIVSGTENLPSIITAADALETSLKHLGCVTERIEGYKRQILDTITRIADARINTPEENAAPHIINMSFAGLESEALILMLDSVGICVSGKSACAGATLEPSHVLAAMGVPDEYIYGSIRISLGAQTTQDEVDYLCEQLPICVKRLRG